LDHYKPQPYTDKELQEFRQEEQNKLSLEQSRRWQKQGLRMIVGIIETGLMNMKKLMAALNKKVRN
jgi:hypothetical protein